MDNPLPSGTMTTASLTLCCRVWASLYLTAVSLGVVTSQVANVSTIEPTTLPTTTTTRNNTGLLRELLLAGVEANEQVLRCYECREFYRQSYDPLNSPCRNNVTTVSLRICGPQHTYCKTERIDYYGFATTLSIERGCAEKGRCPYGCKFNFYGVTHMRCTSCCRTDKCNTDNAAQHPSVTSLPLLMMSVLLIYSGLC